jgi:hypothetical protein
VADKVPATGAGQALFQNFCFPFRPMLHTRPYALATVIRKTTGRELGAFKERNALEVIGTVWTDQFFTLSSVVF